MVSERMRFIVLATALTAGSGGCDWLENDSSKPPLAETPEPQPTETAAIQFPPPSWSEALTAGIRSPAPGYATYDVDPFIAAIIVNAIRSRHLVVEPLGDRQGFRLVSFPAGIPHAALGLRAGDVIEAVNDVPITDVGTVVEALADTRNGLTLTVHRDDVSFTLRYRLTEALAWTDALLGIGADVQPVDSGMDPDAEASPPVENVVADASRGSPRVRPTPPSRPPSGASGPAPGSSKPPTPPPSSPSSVRCPSSTQCEIDRSHFQSLMANPSRLESQARIVPAILNDVHSGYKLKSIKPGSDLAQLGFRSEDKITHINGVDLTNEAAALALYSQASASKVFRVRYERAGRSAQKTITVR